jgi:hypothetical protein
LVGSAFERYTVAGADRRELLYPLDQAGDAGRQSWCVRRGDDFTIDHVRRDRVCAVLSRHAIASPACIFAITNSTMAEQSTTVNARPGPRRCPRA